MFLFPAPFIHNRRELRFTEPLPAKVALLQAQRCCHGKILPCVNVDCDDLKAKENISTKTLFSTREHKNNHMHQRALLEGGF